MQWNQEMLNVSLEEKQKTNCAPPPPYSFAYKNMKFASFKDLPLQRRLRLYFEETVKRCSIFMNMFS